jgi:hypothetical protein
MLHEKCLEHIESPMVIPRTYRGGTLSGGSCSVFQCERLATDSASTFRVPWSICSEMLRSCTKMQQVPSGI